MTLQASNEQASRQKTNRHIRRRLAGMIGTSLLIFNLAQTVAFTLRCLGSASIADIVPLKSIASFNAAP
ncbi:hypothetical protein ccbrp13_36150 [Ktedonobacteria bacterium brp13]|nr:hypothetical protein ccbrp13_36150 [Ktedonobacteria bacterium brp13]